MSNPNTRKSCVVPRCTNTTVRTPEKLFFYVPKDLKMRKKWIKAMNRLDSFGDKSIVYCCEDHFDIETDMENYVKYKLVGGRIKLKKGTIPHKFQCQLEDEKKSKRPSVKKRKHLRKLLIKDEEASTSSLDETEKPEEIFIIVDPKDETIKEEPFSSDDDEQCRVDGGGIMDDAILRINKEIQVNVKVRGVHKSTMTDKYLDMKKKHRGVQVNRKTRLIHKSTMTEKKYFKTKISSYVQT